MGMIFDILNGIERWAFPVVRDFTPAAEARLREMSVEENEDEGWFSRYIGDTAKRYLDKSGFMEYWYDEEDYQKQVIDCYNIGAGDISEICRQARDCDTTYGGKVWDCAHQSENVLRLMTGLAECMNLHSSRYEGIPVSDRINGFLDAAELLTGMTYAEIANITQQRDEQLNLETLDMAAAQAFANDTASLLLFKNYANYIFGLALNWGVVEWAINSAGMIVCNGVEYTIDSFAYFITGQNHTDKMVCKELKGLIGSVISERKTARKYVKSREEAKLVVQQMLDDLKNRTGDIEDGPIANLREFVDILGGVTVFKKLCSSCPELIDYLYADYTEGLRVIDEIADCNPNCSPSVQKALETIRVEYNDKWAGALHKAVEFGSDVAETLTEKAVKKWIKENIIDIPFLSEVLDAFDVDSKMEGIDMLLSQEVLFRDLQAGYETALARLRSANCTEADFKTAQNAFDLLKEATKNILSTYRDMINDVSKEIWLNEQITKVEKATMDNYQDCFFEYP